MRIAILALIAAAMMSSCSSSRGVSPEEVEKSMNAYARWNNGPPKGEDYFPIAVWLQSPANAVRYKEAGINLYVGLWQGPTEDQLSELRAAGMQVICAQNEVGLQHVDDELIVAWMHGDEPDNAQSLPDGSGYGPPILPEKIVADYEVLKGRDSSRPIFLNLGQGVAWDEYVGRGVRTGHPEDYAEYAKGSDILSFDIYPVVSRYPQITGNLWYVARGVERLVEWSKLEQPVWNCIECTRINAEDKKATPHQVRAEVWMALVHGSMGLIYFVHEWQPKFNEHALLDDAEMLAAVTEINRRVQALAPALNSPTVEEGIEVTSANAEVPVATMLKRHGGATYLFAVGMREGATRASFSITGLPEKSRAEVLDEGRRIEVVDGRFEDDFGPYDVHLYEIR